MLRTKTRFSTEIVVCREPHAGALRDGTEYVAHLGERFRADSEIVEKAPFYFSDDGDRLVPFERPEPPDDEPSTVLQRPKRKMLKSRKDFSEERDYIGSNAWGIEERRKIRITLHKDGLTDPREWWLDALTDRERERLFEEVED